MKHKFLTLFQMRSGEIGGKYRKPCGAQRKPRLNLTVASVKGRIVKWILMFSLLKRIVVFNSVSLWFCNAVGSDNETKEAIPDVDVSPITKTSDTSVPVVGDEKPKRRRKRKPRPNNRNRQRRLVKWIAERFPESFEETVPTIEAKREAAIPLQSSASELFDQSVTSIAPALLSRSRESHRNGNDSPKKELNNASGVFFSETCRNSLGTEATPLEPNSVQSTDMTSTIGCETVNRSTDAIKRHLQSGPDPCSISSPVDSLAPGLGGFESSRRGHILEIAGGQGELAVRLAMFYHRRVVMIDPRTADIARTFETQVCTRLPLNRKQQWKDTLEREDAGYLRDKVKEKISHIATYLTKESVENDPRVREAIENASLVVALHPDKPTEDIIDAALKHRKPFVVIPCCVFPNFFQRRTVVMDDGQAPVRVRNYEQLCVYLLRKHPGFRMETLPFEGRNIAIWWDGVSDEAESDTGA